jgi:hypothetical protein
MTSAFFSRRLALLASIAASLVLSACGHSGSGGGQGSVRSLNLTSDLSSIDLYLNSNIQFKAQNTNVLSGYQIFDAAAYTVNVNSAGNSTTLFTGAYSVAKDAHYTAVVWGPQAQLHLSTIPEDEDTTAIATGNTRIRMFNATTETGSVDVYITAAGADLSASTPTQGALASGQLAGFREIPAGTYQLRITGLGKPDDIRLDTSVTLNASKYQTLMITAGAGGTLVNGTLIEQQGSATALTNTKARVRLVASVDSAGVVAVNVSNTLISSGLISPRVQGFYTLVQAGNVNLNLRVNNVAVLTTPQAVTLTPGADYTLMVYGSASNVQLSTIIDDNRLPLSTTRTKIRLVNGVATLDPLALSVDFGAVSASSYVVAGTAAPYAQIASNLGALIEVDSPSLGALYQTTRTNGDPLAAQGVYSIFVLSGKTTPTGFLSNERP